MAKLFCFFGLPAAGKSTIINQLYNVNGDCLLFLPRYTSRPARPTEIGRPIPDYCFIDPRWFKALKTNGCFFATEDFHSYSYGIRSSDINLILSNCLPGVIMPGYCIVDLKKSFPKQVETIFITVPGIDLAKSIFLPEGKKILSNRMKERGDDEASIEARLDLASQIIEKDRLHLLADHIVIKDDQEGEESALLAVQRIVGLV
jgi:guanylate kinase